MRGLRREREAAPNSNGAGLNGVVARLSQNRAKTQDLGGMHEDPPWNPHRDFLDGPASSHGDGLFRRATSEGPKTPYRCQRITVSGLIIATASTTLSMVKTGCF
jgi:hypothetical protein